MCYVVHPCRKYERMYRFIGFLSDGVMLNVILNYALLNLAVNPGHLPMPTNGEIHDHFQLCGTPLRVFFIIKSLCYNLNFLWANAQKQNCIFTCFPCIHSSASNIY